MFPIQNLESKRRVGRVREFERKGRQPVGKLCTMSYGKKGSNCTILSSWLVYGPKGPESNKSSTTLKRWRPAKTF